MSESEQRERDPEAGLSAAVAAARGIRPPKQPEPFEGEARPGEHRPGPWGWLLPRWRGAD